MKNSKGGDTPEWCYSGINSSDVIEIFLNPGEYFVGGSDFQVRTFLGSCVSITLWHPRLRFGAMSHYLLSSRPGNVTPGYALEASCKLDGKYADEVFALMVRELRDAKVPVTECQAKIFGGGNMFPNRPVPDQLDIGLKNGQAAKYLLVAYGIPIVSEHLFGIGHREIIFNLGNGDVWVRQAKPDFLVAMPD
ncbi:MAG: chemotaxis protein CheD [Methylovulum sp.]|nr:chemotaxis protein CheD [Methylovulum sp.]